MHTRSILALNFSYHFERALFGILAPVLAPVFFPQTDYVTSLILYFAPYHIATKPIAALFWGYVSDHYGRAKATYAALWGMALSTLAVSCTPSTTVLGGMAPLFFVTMRTLRGMFSIGASTGAPLLLLETTGAEKRNRASGRYEVSGMSGVFVGTLLAALLSLMGVVEQGWRVLFLAAAGLAIWQLTHFPPINPVVRHEPVRLPQFTRSVLRVMLLTGFSCANYNLTMLLMHSYLPERCPLTHAHIQLLHLCFILLDIAFLPLFSRLADRVTVHRLITWMLAALLLFLASLALLPYPLTLPTILWIRFGLLLFGVAIAAPYHHWVQQQFPQQLRFRGIAMSKVLGKQWIGGPAVSLSLLLMQWCGHESALFLYLGVVTALTLCVHLGAPKTQN